jgi:hypothetical protein
LLDLICIGASQLQHLRAAYDELQQSGTPSFRFHAFPLAEEPYKPGAYVENGKVKFVAQFDEDFRDYLCSHDPPVIFTYLGGAEHVPIALTNSARPYDVLLPGQRDSGPAPGAEIIPYDLMVAACRSYVSGWPVWFPHLREFSSRPIFQIALPPPVTGDEHIRRGAGGAFAEQIERYGVAPQRLRAKVWRLCVEATKFQCARLDVGVVGPLPETLDENECLLPRYRGGDAVHPNNYYGHLLLRHMLSIAAEHRQEGRS